MPNTVIGEEAVIDRAIIDKEVQIERSCMVGTGEDVVNKLHPHLLDTGVTVLGEKVRLPRGTQVGRNVLIFPFVGAGDLPGSHIESGETLEPRVLASAQGRTL